MTLAPRSGAVTVLLGATQAGKTSLMRIMAGLDVPTAGAVRVDGVDVTGMPVRERNVAMVYQQFINYPSLKVRGEKNKDQRVRELAEGLDLWMPLDHQASQMRQVA
ncbi:MAG: ATP-binding cassette domain-containing protein [Rhodoferax sp.]|nr:ATP-binding cassette domain-containing protein [Rhodoferax sp.]MDZ7890916.1 ATP-binding cassette domain-containing protein [Rhodoferax sp.]